MASHSLGGGIALIGRTGSCKGMSRLRLVVPGHIEEPEPALVQYGYLWGQRQNAQVSQKKARQIENSQICK
jgi:hypothetical protein